jgi:hypothetical protein
MPGAAMWLLSDSGAPCGACSALSVEECGAYAPARGSGPVWADICVRSPCGVSEYRLTPAPDGLVSRSQPGSRRAPDGS